MARIRSIKPGFFTSLDIADLQRDTRLHFTGLWTYADDHGRGIDDPRLIKAAIWPLDDDITTDDIERMQDELSKHERLTRYSVGGRRYFQIHKWHDHQKPNRPQPSALPEPSDGVPLSPSDDSVNDHGTITEDSSPEGRGEEREKEGEQVHPCVLPDGEDTHAHDEVAEQFDTWWQTWPDRNGKKRHKGRALNAFRALTLEQRRRAWIGARNYAASGEGPCDAFRFLRRDTAGEFPFDDWQTPADPTQRAGPSKGASYAAMYEAAADEAERREALG